MMACAEDDRWEAATGRMLTDSRALLLCMIGLDVLVLGVGVSVHVSADGGGAKIGCMHSRRNGKNQELMNSRLARGQERRGVLKKRLIPLVEPFRVVLSYRRVPGTSFQK